MTVSATELAHLWRQVNKELHSHMKHTFHECNLPSMAWLLLHHIHREPGMTVSQLARKIGTAKSHVSNIVDQLVGDSLLSKETDPADRRLLRLYATQQSLGTIARLTEQAGAGWDRVITELPDGEWQEIIRALKMLLVALEKTNATMGAVSE